MTGTHTHNGSEPTLPGVGSEARVGAMADLADLLADTAAGRRSFAPEELAAGVALLLESAVEVEQTILEVRSVIAALRPLAEQLAQGGGLGAVFGLFKAARG